MNWISVEDKRPEEKQSVLVYARVRDIWDNHYNNIFTASLNENKWAYDLAFSAGVIITHWMPLPKPPEDK